MTAPTRLEQLEAERDTYRDAYQAEATSLRADYAAAERRWLDYIAELRKAPQVREAALKARLAATEAHLVRLKLEVRALRRGMLG